jgi:uncharacterized protein (TIGR00297 family)
MKMVVYFALSLAFLTFLSLLGLPYYIIAASVPLALLGRYERKIGCYGFLLLGIPLSFIAGFLFFPSYSIFFICTVGSLSALILHLARESNDPPLLLFGSGMAMWLVDSFQIDVYPYEVLVALFLTLAVGTLALKLRVLDESGVMAGSLVGVLVILFTNFGWFLLLLSFFILGGISTSYKHELKLSLGTAHAKRGYKNVFGNALVPVSLAISSSWNPVLLAGFLGAVATATSDTLATEIGETQKKKPRLITSFKEVPPGTSGAISLLGELSALAGALGIGILAFLLGLINPFSLLLATFAGGIFGTHLDSFLGAMLEGKILNNHLVNLIATAGGAFISLALYLYLI